MTDSTQEPVLEPLGPEAQDLEYTRAFRKQIIDQTIADAIKNKDIELLSLLTRTMDGIDKAALGKLKIAAKKEETAAQQNLSETAAQYLKALSDQQMRQRDQTVGPVGTVPTLGDHPEIVITDDAMDVAPKEERFSEFTARVGQSGGESR